VENNLKTWENPEFVFLGMKQRLPVNLPSCQLKYVEIIAGKNQWIGWLDSIPIPW
jgi:hypothetical protein